MKRWLSFISACALTGFALASLSAADAGITFVGLGFVAGDGRDLSGLAGQSICQRDDTSVCIDKATMGGFGSAVAYTGHDNVFLAVPDRGPFDGRTTPAYLDRFHFLHIALDTNKSFPNITTTLLDTRFLKNERNQNFVGDAYAFDTANPPATRRLDPEGVAIGRDGTFFVSDEYGPYIFNFDRQGHIVSRIDVPPTFLLAPPPAGNPSGDLDANATSLELYPAFNVTGRQANRGMEGLAITPDGRMIAGIMQNALLQDHGVDPVTIGRIGENNRILTIDLATGLTHEYVYVMDAVNQGRGVNEMIALNDHEFLVLERDNRTRVPTPPATSAGPNLKRIYRIDLRKTGLTDVTGMTLPATGAQLAAMNITPVTKTLFIDMLDPIYKVSATQTIKDVIAEKIEGLAWGPDLADGRHVLYVFSDNDLFPGLPTQIYAFAVDAAAAHVTVERQQLPGPLYPPGQVKKALK